MGLLLAPYSNAMRIGQGFNSYTQEICIDDAVITDPARAENVLTNDGTTMSSLAALMGRPSAWIREKEIQLDIAMIERKENKKAIEATKEDGEADDGGSKEQTNKIVNSDTERATPDSSEVVSEAPDGENEESDGNEPGSDNKDEKEDLGLESTTEKSSKATPDKAPESSTSADDKEPKAATAKEGNSASPGDKPKTSSDDKPKKEEDKESSLTSDGKRDAEKKVARTAAEDVTEKTRLDAKKRAEDEASRETARAKKRAEAKATAAASLKAYTQEQMEAIRREKFGEDPGSIARPPAQKTGASYTYKETGRRGPSQIVTYTSKFVDKLSDVTEDMNISGSLSIKYGAIGGSGKGSFIDADKFRESDLNFYISVKVINQSINYRDSLVYNPVKSVGDDQDRFHKVFGDSYISGFLEGGEFNAIVSMKVLNKAKMTDIQAEAKVALTVGAAEISAQANVDIAKKNISNNTETTIQVSWSGGGFIKPMDQTWDVDSLTAAAARFPDLVALSPQRTYAILTKYETLRSFVALQPPGFTPLQYEVAQMYTSALMDTYMEYKSLYKTLGIDIANLEIGVTQFEESDTGSNVLVSHQNPNKTRQSSTSSEVAFIEDVTPFPASSRGLDQARRAIRAEMVRIVNEVDAITKSPATATDPNHKEPFQTPIAFKERLPKRKPVEKAPAVPLSGTEIQPDKAPVVDKSKHPELYVETPNSSSLSSEEQAAVDQIMKDQPSISDNLRLTSLCGSPSEGSFFTSLEFQRPNFVISDIFVEIAEGSLAFLSCKYTNGLVLTRGGSRGGVQVALRDFSPKEGVISCTIETGRVVGSSQDRVTAIRLHTNRGRSLVAQAPDYMKAGPKKQAYRGGVSYENLILTDFDPPMGGATLRGFWGRSRDVEKGIAAGGIWRLGALWGDLEEPVADDVSSSQVVEEVHEEYQPRTDRFDTLGNGNPERKVVERLSFTKKVIFPQECLSVPRLLYGFLGIEMGDNKHIRARLTLSNLDKTSFELTTDTWFSATFLSSSYIKLPNVPKYQFQDGRVSTYDIPRDWNRARLKVDGNTESEVYTFWISFSTPYDSPPKVISWLTHIDCAEPPNQRLDLTVKNISTTGFLLEIVSWSDSLLVSARVSWLAYNSSVPGIASGTIEKTNGWQNVNFPPGIFTKKPQMWVALRKIDATPTPVPPKVQVDYQNATTKSVDIKCGCDDSKVTLWGCGASWLAIE